MADDRVELNDAGIQAFLRSTELMAELQRRADAVAAAAGEGFKAEIWQGHDRAHATVTATTHAARRAEATDRVLSRAIDAARF